MSLNDVNGVYTMGFTYVSKLLNIEVIHWRSSEIQEVSRNQQFLAKKWNLKKSWSTDLRMMKKVYAMYHYMVISPWKFGRDPMKSTGGVDYTKPGPSKRRIRRKIIITRVKSKGWGPIANIRTFEDIVPIPQEDRGNFFYCIIISSSYHSI